MLALNGVILHGVFSDEDEVIAPRTKGSRDVVPAATPARR